MVLLLKEITLSDIEGYIFIMPMKVWAVITG